MKNSTVRPKTPDAQAISDVLDDKQWTNGYMRAEGGTGKREDRVRWNERIPKAKSLRADVLTMQKWMLAGDRTGDLTASEQRTYDQLDVAYNMLNDLINEEPLIDRSGVIAPDYSAEAAYGEGKPLARSQSFTGYAAARGILNRPSEPEDGEDLDLNKFLRGAATGDWRGAEAEQHSFRNALSGASSGAGGFLLPTILSTRLIDLARAKTRVLQAGATVVPMESRTVDVPKWTKDPAAAWRAENAAFAEDDATIDKITLTAKGLGSVTKVSRELVEDTNIVPELEEAIANSFALELDRAALYGTGAANQPTGVKTNAGVTKTPLGANGATPTWDALIDAVGRLRDVNEDPNAQIMADRSLRALSKVKGSDGQYVTPPTYLDGVTRYDTNQVPINLTQGSSNVASDIFTADWAQLYIGVRVDLRIEILKERYMADFGQYGFVAYWRGDMQVARPKAFDVVTGALA